MVNQENNVTVRTAKKVLREQGLFSHLVIKVENICFITISATYEHFFIVFEEAFESNEIIDALEADVQKSFFNKNSLYLTAKDLLKLGFDQIDLEALQEKSRKTTKESIEAIKNIRESKGLGLQEAKDEFESNLSEYLKDSNKNYFKVFTDELGLCEPIYQFWEHNNIVQRRVYREGNERDTALDEIGTLLFISPQPFLHTAGVFCQKYSVFAGIAGFGIACAALFLVISLVKQVNFAGVNDEDISSCLEWFSRHDGPGGYDSFVVDSWIKSGNSVVEIGFDRNLNGFTTRLCVVDGDVMKAPNNLTRGRWER